MKKGIALLLIFSFGCRQSSVSEKELQKIADWECKAISIREQRYALADKIRFAQDTLLHVVSKANTVRLKDNLQHFLQQKETLLQQSLQLADTIHHQLDSLRKFAFANTNDRIAFDQKLKEELERRGCNR